jgi:hypothetical protein
MNLPVHFEVTALGLAASLAGIVGGAPIFAAGWRAWVLRRDTRHLEPAALGEEASGLVCAEGRVLPDAGLVAPLSGRLCAGWELDVQAARTRLAARAERHHDFTIESGDVLAEVRGTAAVWRLEPTAERTIAAAEALPAAIERAFATDAEFQWLRRLGAPLRVTERALVTGATVHVVAVAEPVAAEVEVLRSGTDDTPLEVGGPRVRLACGEPLERVFVSATRPAPEQLAPPAWRAAGAIAGPAMTLGGLAYLLFAMLQRFGGPA